jgi:predicted metalloprotease
MADGPDETKNTRWKPSLGLIGAGIAILAVIVVAVAVVLNSDGNSKDATGPSGKEPVFSADAAEVATQVDDFWAKTFADQSRTYESATIGTFADAAKSPCKRLARNQVSFYCVTDRTIYLNDEFQAALGSSKGNFAQAYVLAHLYGHHVQEVLGIWDKVVGLELQDPSSASVLAHNVELQADCLAGFGIGGVAKPDAPLPQTFTDAVNLVVSVAEPRVKPLTGALNPETWQNGPLTEEEDWFARGLALTDVAACDTFSG